MASAKIVIIKDTIIKKKLRFVHVKHISTSVNLLRVLRLFEFLSYIIKYLFVYFTVLRR